MSSCATKLQRHLDIIVDEGKRYGLELNWDKTFAMQVNNPGQNLQPCGAAAKIVHQVTYLGGLISNSATARPEVTRRLGESMGIFKKLNQCWSHANISRNRKTEISIT